ncbi:tetratricopeptide repeat protein [Streptomyces sp. NPDC059373]
MGESGRMGLVVSARWFAYPDDQSYMSDAAEAVAEALYDPVLGACIPAIAGLRVLHDPPKDVLEDKLRQAFESASWGGSTLFLYLIGHGYADNDLDRYHLIPSDHPFDYDAVPEHAYPLGERIAALHAEFPDTDGLILAIDACQSGRMWERGRREWMPHDMDRLALFTATGRESAWYARFTQAVGESIETGIPSAGYYLRPADFDSALKELRDQSAHHLTRNNSDDAGLWLSSNRATRTDRVEQMVRRVTRSRGLQGISERYQKPEGDDPVSRALEKHRAVAVLGPSGCGKSATLQMAVVDRLDPRRTGHARSAGQAPQAMALFPVAGDTTPERFAEEVADQLDISSGGLFGRVREDMLKSLPAAEADRLPAVERWLMGPLRRLRADAEVLIVIDALDQLPDPAASELLACVTELRDNSSYSHVRLLVSARHRHGRALPTQLPDGFRGIRLPKVTDHQIQRYLRRRAIPAEHVSDVGRIADGNWLIVTLLGNRLAGPAARDERLPTTLAGLYNELLEDACGGDAGTTAWSLRLAPVLGVLVCAGPGVAVPLEVVRAASDMLAGPGSVAAVRAAAVALHDLVERMDPGTDREELTLVHPTLIEHLRGTDNAYPLPDAPRAHSAIASALATLAPMDRNRGAGGDSDPIRRYAEVMEATHRWEAGDLDGAIQALINRPAARAADNRNTWVRWSRRINDRLGPADPRSLLARRELASWTSRCGMFTSASDLFDRLLPDVAGALGSDDSLALRVALDAALSRGVSGHASDARDQLRQLVPRISRVEGPYGVLTLEARHALGNWIGLAGAPRTATEELAAVLASCREHLGNEHPETLATRNSLARWTGESGRPAEAVTEFAALLPLQSRLLGPLHRETLRTRSNIAYWSGESGRPQEALAIFRELVGDQIRALGEDHPDTLRTRHGIGLWTGVNGDAAEAIRILTGVLTDRVRVLGPDHPDTLRTQNNLGRWTGFLGRYGESIGILEEVQERRARTLGATHPDTMRTVNNIIDWTGASGDHARARQLARELLPLQEEILGPSHQDTLRTRFNEAKWQAADGDTEGALAALRILLEDQWEVLGRSHPNALRTAEEIAALEGEAPG